MKVLFLICTSVGFISAQSRPLERAETVGYLVNPAKTEWSPSVVNRLRAPAGFTISVFAQELGNLRMIAVSPAGGVYITRRNSQDASLLRDTDADGAADQMPLFLGICRG
ncbi:MAG TPA: hypothetical protein VEX68_20935 [Bryobacteraceae bacterium]|nr:hypothetical protein [Bryobacteraceae bacterium]